MSYKLKGTQEVEAVQFDPAMEPGNGLFIVKTNDVFTGAYVVSNGARIEVTPGDFIVTYEDGSKEILSETDFNAKFEAV